MKLRNLFDSPEIPDDFYLYVDTAFTHEGDLNYLFQMIDAAVKGGADGIKFQMLLDGPSAYVDFDSSNSMTFSEEEWQKVLNYTKNKGLEIIVLPIDITSIHFCKKHLELISGVEVHSICFNEFFFLNELKSLRQLPIILGIGGRTLDDIRYALEILDSQNIIMMYGFQSFPTNIGSLNLGRIEKIREFYDYPIGYADHTKYDDSYGDRLIEYSYFLGCRIFEKHLILEKGRGRTDFESAVDKEDIQRIRNNLERLNQALGNPNDFDLNEAEAKYRAREKSLVYAKSLESGSTITSDNLTYKVSPKKSDFEQKDLFDVVGKKLKRSVSMNDPVLRDDF